MGDRFAISTTPLPGLLHVLRHPREDHRGYLERLYCMDEFSQLIGPQPILQINRTLTKQLGVIRGMHLQLPPHAEKKIITCLAGRVFDVAVDLRRGSKTFLQWHSVVLDEAEHNMILIPEGFAHGFQTLTPDCEMLYLHTAAHHPSSEWGMHHQDPLVQISWPLPASETSQRDSAFGYLPAGYAGIEI